MSDGQDVRLSRVGGGKEPCKQSFRLLPVSGGASSRVVSVQKWFGIRGPTLVVKACVRCSLLAGTTARERRDAVIRSRKRLRQVTTLAWLLEEGCLSFILVPIV